MTDHDGRILVVDVDIFGSKFHLVNTYFPDKPYLKEDFIFSLYPYLASSYPVIWCGDHNIVTDPHVDRLPPKNNHDYCYKQLDDLLTYFSFADTCRTIYPNGKYFTFRGPDSRSRIDKILVSKSLDVIGYEQLDLLVSDHDLLIAHIQYKSLICWGKSRWKNNCSLYENADFLQDFEIFWTIEAQDISRVTNPNKWWLNTKYQFKLSCIKKGKENSTLRERGIQIAEAGLQSISDAIVRDPRDHSLFRKYDRAKKELATQQINDVKEKLFKEKANSILHGVKPTKTFFMKYKRNVTREIVKCLKDGDGTPHYNINKIIDIVELHFQNLFSENVVDDDTMQLFLNGVTKIDELSDVNIMRPITLEELEDIISALPSGKSPGPDGLSYEFYQKIFLKGHNTFLKRRLLDVFNHILFTATSTGKLPSKMVEGTITLVPKRPPYDLIENYRPISLLNTDLKIITKIISLRLKPLISKILHPSQYAQPGKDISLLNSQIRDVQNDMENSEEDGFFVCVDFKAAFDKVSHQFLFKMLEKIGCSTQLLNFVKSLYHNASSIVYVNGHRTKKIKIKSGIRQGCTFSRDLFTIAENPLLQFLNECPNIQKYRCKSNQNVLTLCFTDDMNFCTPSLSSLLNCLFYINKYKAASGLEINFLKTKGRFFNNKNALQIGHLPQIQWVDRIQILGVHYGTGAFINSQWVEKIQEMKNEISFYKSVGPNTLQHKAILSKSKLLPIFSYISNVHIIPRVFVDQ